MRRWRIFCHVFILHALIIGGPMVWLWAHGKLFPPKENAFKVKLGDITPSHAEVVGPPERLRPAANPSPPAPAPPPEPAVPTPPKPKPRPVPSEPVVKPLPKPKPRPRAKPKPKPRPKKVVRPKAEPKVTLPPRHSTRPVKPSPRHSHRPTSVAEAQSQVYRPSGGSNFNPNVKIGSRDAGQVKGPADHKTPQGGLTKSEEAYYASLKKFLDVKWVEPSRILLGDLRPKTAIELDIAPDGRVLRARIVQASGNGPMDDSIRRMFKVLDRVPAPPNGRMKISVLMEVQ